MPRRLNSCRRFVNALTCAIAVLCTAAQARAGVTVAITPSFQVVPTGTDFSVNVDVTAAGSAFNGYELVIGYDPTVLTLLPTSPTTLQQGCLMTGGCSTACGSTFHNFSVTADSITVTDVMLCNQVALTGPGHVYQLRFHGSVTAQTTQIRLRRAVFYNDGVAISPVICTGTSIGLGVGLGVDPDASGRPHALRVEPNPSFGSVRIVADDDVAGLAEAHVVDLLGRVVRRLEPASLGAHTSLVWDGRDARGVRVSPGLYLVRIRRAGHTLSTRVMLLR